LHFGSELKEALLVNDHVQHITKRQVIIEQVSEFNLPTIYTVRAFVEAGRTHGL
jgi:hypothetical protein